ncbi:hypothetical protein DFA_10912 [Cavenderia fasciculata]|uniref:Uncharacterized protein n=1 Tax=Cavenderia fasciculata TaxID=261658 RepID=F4QBR6_CACFS|nr:uncharacterized protein DFA_10912 [Cavenderia fasciculata]EGG14654.1 hypothetical protein DFA_10912 [Cavenderia fasciculata]|eukprot:XP_004351162.1 hypothetical protein DFA_10912 [Cavenderia fasciculata]
MFKSTITITIIFILFYIFNFGLCSNFQLYKKNGNQWDLVSSSTSSSVGYTIVIFPNQQVFFKLAKDLDYLGFNHSVTVDSKAFPETYDMKFNFKTLTQIETDGYPRFYWWGCNPNDVLFDITNRNRISRGDFIISIEAMDRTHNCG